MNSDVGSEVGLDVKGRPEKSKTRRVESCRFPVQEAQLAAFSFSLYILDEEHLKQLHVTDNFPYMCPGVWFGKLSRHISPVVLIALLAVAL